jgi:hypothetical protein
VLVLAAHVGCTALALMHWQEDDSQDAPAGPIIVEMVAMPVATPQDMPDVAHGPLMEEAQLFCRKCYAGQPIAPSRRSSAERRSRTFAIGLLRRAGVRLRRAGALFCG